MAIHDTSLRSSDEILVSQSETIDHGQLRGNFELESTGRFHAEDNG